MSDLFDGLGHRVALSSKIGSGGEGAVYEVAGSQDLVAKLYHDPIREAKQAKLKIMVSGSSDLLRLTSAWPLQTLHYKRGGDVRGFLMPKVSGSQPIHHLYGPSHRKQQFPDKDWAFIVSAARNVAAAFEAIHGHGHVIGDVNPNLVFVSGSSIVKLIDCDSFQVLSGGNKFLCEVGVPHFTPPELQTYSSFRDIVRTVNHDNFGLALILFHLLLMGRHPFSGVHVGSRDVSLEQAIQRNLYAFSQAASTLQVKPPPNSVLPGILPREVASLFENAFSASSAVNGNRPTPRMWVMALDSLKTNIRTCTKENSHKYYGGLRTCPWCEQEQKSGNYFFLSVIQTTPFNGAFNITQIWSRIQAVSSPGALPNLNFGTIQLSPRPLPDELAKAKSFATGQKVVGFLAAIVLIMAWPSGWLFGVMVGAAIFFSAKVHLSGEYEKRKIALALAKRQLSEAMEQWNRDGSGSQFSDKLAEFVRLKAEYDDLPNLLAKEKALLQKNMRSLQLEKYLERFFIEKADIPGVGSGRKATLQSFGIETAADVNRGAVIRIPGFGEGLTGNLVSWRKSLESRFVFDPSKGIDLGDLNKLNQRISQKKRDIEARLSGGADQLNHLRSQVLNFRTQMASRIQYLAKQVSQAEADISLVS